WVITVGAQNSRTIREAQNEKYSVRLLQQEGVGYKTDQTPKWTFAVINKEKHGETLIQMQNETDEIEEVVLLDDVFVVLGGNRYAAQTATLFDMLTLQQKDFIWGHKMGLSAMKHYLIYDECYPRISNAGATSGVILVYDFSKSPNE